MVLALVEKTLASGYTVAVLFSLFIVSQLWIVSILGETGPDLFQLQTVCLANPTPQWTGARAREILQKWTSDDINRFRRHYLLDSLLHPILYSFFCMSALFFELKQHETTDKKANKAARSTGCVIAALIVLGATCDLLENQRHSSIEFEPTLDASDSVLWEGCLFASAKWLMLHTVVAWLLWQYLHNPQLQSKQTTEDKSKKQTFDKEWIGPRPEDHLNTPCEAEGLLEVQGRKIPWTMSAPGAYSDPDRSYVVSPYGHYIGYGEDEVKIRTANSPVLRFLLLAIVKTIGRILQLLSFDENVCFNNLILSTNLWPNTIEWSEEQVDSINQELLSTTTKLSETNRAIVWRSVDALSQPKLFEVLSNSSSCLMVPSRIVNFSDYSGEDFDKNKLYQKNNFKKDIKIFKKLVGWDLTQNRNVDGYEKTKYEMATIPAEELTREQADRIIDLFNQLYLDKYSLRNPQLTPEGLIRMAHTGFLTVDVLRERQTGEIVGFSTGSTVDGVRTPSFIGYDLRDDPENILYRLVMVMIHCNMVRDGVEKIHQSGGASEFKRHRGSRTTVEYSAVFLNHLPFYQRLPWMITKLVTDRIITVKNAY